MRSGVGLCLLGLLGLCSFILRQVAADVQPSVSVPCDDPSVEKVVSNAVHKFNERITIGHHLALFQIRRVSKTESGSDLVYSLDFTTRRSDCEADSPKPWEDCDYLPTGHKPIRCNATVQVSGAEIQTQQVDCFFDAHIHPEKAPCLGCPVEISVDSEELKVPLFVSISKYNSMSDSTHLFSLHTIEYASRQVMGGFRFKVKFDIRKTICAKAENTELNEQCVPNEQDVEYANCNSTIDTAPWRLEPPVAQIQCQPGALSANTIARRRPPGWSPLRRVDRPSAAQPASHLPAAPTTPAPTPKASEEKKKKKEDSSEEDMKAADDKLHCPSKPWKPFHPRNPSANANAEAGTKAPAFSDIDLLG
ncbi:kininogen-1 isoform X2 [Cynoglossus semilaevis]|uniref:kininogen-1 isoform X2 n=1 Tax=Cynoglossus semilaevis TaxID=244447 RepID=UPI0007DC83EA|nr:kininogen-1 isoform X2 [Cynoglossus semilaevis]